VVGLNIALENLVVILFSSRGDRRLGEDVLSGAVGSQRVFFVIVLTLLLLLLAGPLLSQQPFTNHCAACHGEDARGTAKGPGLAMNPRVAEQSIEQLRTYLERGNPAAGMPSFADLTTDELASLVRYLRRINADTILVPVAAPGSTTKVSWGPPQPGDWLTYNGSESGNRYSPLDQIRTSNVSSLKLKWVFPIAYFGLETTPLAAAGVLYVTGPNQVFALDAATGAPQWHYSRPSSPGMVGDARLGTNRGVAILQDKVFFLTDNAHLLALDRGTGKLL
jgi:cytochrome c553